MNSTLVQHVTPGDIFEVVDGGYHSLIIGASEWIRSPPECRRITLLENNKVFSLCAQKDQNVNVLGLIPVI